MRTAHFFIDNLNIGGFQRLCLDQSYEFAAEGHNVEIHILDDIPNSNSTNFVNLERSIISRLNISISYLSSSHRGQIRMASNILRSVGKDDLVISHSLRATVVLWVSKRLVRTGHPFITTIHQLPSLSAPFQRTRRLLYAQLSPLLTAYSNAVKRDWDSRVSKSLLFRLFLSKEISVLRNGIYLSRLPNNQGESVMPAAKRIIYLGRNTGWKGIDILLRYVELESLHDFDILLMLPEIDPKWEQELREKFGNRIQISVGRTLSSYTPRAGDVHFYAAQYGPNARFVESISLNCLEMAALGVPSVVTSGGLETWPDLAKMNVFAECDWKNLDATSAVIRQLSDLRFTTSTITNIRELVNIKQNVQKIELSLRKLSLNN
jgi:glycosyltransferase involved in cell wall biosynthesis